MNSKRLYWLLLGVVGLLFVGLLAGTYGANKLLTAKASELTTLKAKNAALSAEQLSLAKAKKDIVTYNDLDKIARSVVPEDKDQAEATREIVNIAAQYGVNLASITFPASTLGLTASGQSTTAAPSGPTSAAAPVAASASASANAAKLSQLQPVKNIPGVYQLVIIVAGDPTKPVAYDKFVAFLSALEHNRRTAQVSGITIAPNADNRSLLSFNLTLDEYIKP